jgi:hypothetical protein
LVGDQELWVSLEQVGDQEPGVNLVQEANQERWVDRGWEEIPDSGVTQEQMGDLVLVDSLVMRVDQGSVEVQGHWVDLGMVVELAHPEGQALQVILEGALPLKDAELHTHHPSCRSRKTRCYYHNCPSSTAHNYFLN